MKPGQASRTAELVCIARAIAHVDASAPRFSDPTAVTFLEDEAKKEVENFRRGRPRDLRARTRWEFMRARAAMMAVRTIFIDDVVRDAAAPQVVILGAGLDGRAWRMPELADAIVFEVDHPDTQRAKRARIAGLEQRAKDVRFVPVDFTKDDLDARLADAGHDPTKPTTWIWEGVVMYLTREEVEATLTIVSRRSAPQSRLAIVYIRPGGLLVRVVGMLVSRVGEPFRSKFTAEEMRRLLARHGFDVELDEDLPASAARLAPGIVDRARRVRHMRMLRSSTSRAGAGAASGLRT
jgi:methyltransferase (TIGR00027 family)